MSEMCLRGDRGAARRGFSLIELALVVALLALLISMTVVALSAVRSAGRITGSLANLRSNHQVLVLYANDYRDGVPVLALPGTNRVEWESARPSPAVRYFSVSWLWAQVLGTRYLGPPPWRSMVSPVMPAGAGSLAQSYQLSCAMYADVAFWNQDTRTGPDQWRPLHLADVVFPSRKALLVDGVQWDRGERGALLGVERGRAGLTVAIDGSAAGRASSEIKRGYWRGDGPWTGAGSWHQADFYATLHTLGGVGGVDW